MRTTELIAKNRINCYCYHMDCLVVVTNFLVYWNIVELVVIVVIVHIVIGIVVIIGN